MSQHYLLVAALAMETPELAQYAPIVHTGVGKINASIQLYEAILTYRPELVINYGTAGALCATKAAGIYEIETFVQRDMDVRGLGFPRGQTPFIEGSLPKATGIVLGTGDSFVMDVEKDLEGLEVPIDLVDMEAYALKAVCDHHNIPFRCYKYVTDTADDESHNDWAENVAKGSDLFAKRLVKEFGYSTLLNNR
jgi:adenosylhomocysteine nucleosidase